MSTISVRVEKSGRILIPVLVRRRLHIKEGASDLLLNVDETPIGITTRAQALARVQKRASAYIAPGRVFSEELIEEKREEARRELAE